MGWGLSLVVEYLPSMCEVLSLIPNTTETKTKQTNKNKDKCFPRKAILKIHKVSYTLQKSKVIKKLWGSCSETGVSNFKKKKK